MAEWKPFDLTWGRSIYYCTECKEGIEVPTSCGKPMYKFCPMCGARMDTADTPQTAQKIAELQEMCGIEIDVDDFIRKLNNLKMEVKDK